MDGLADAAKALAEPATKFIDVVSRGIGRAYDPRYKKRMADASAYELDTCAEAVRRNIDLPILLDRDGIRIDSTDIIALAERANRRAVLQEMRKQQNIEAIVGKAYEEIQKETEVSSEPVDDDWIIRFFNSVEDISNEKLRIIWAKLLAGEIKLPHSYSIRTLDILRSLSSGEAALVEQLACCSFRQHKRSFIPNDPKLLETYNIKYNDLFLLSCAGIISHTPLEMKLQMKEAPRIINNDRIIGVFDVRNGAQDVVIRIPIYCFTTSGHEMLNVVTADNKRSCEFALKYLSSLKKEHSNCVISAFQIRCFEGDLIHHDSVSLI